MHVYAQMCDQWDGDSAHPILWASSFSLSSDCSSPKYPGTMGTSEELIICLDSLMGWEGRGREERGRGKVYVSCLYVCVCIRISVSVCMCTGRGIGQREGWEGSRMMGMYYLPPHTVQATSILYTNTTTLKQPILFTAPLNAHLLNG